MNDLPELKIFTDDLIPLIKSFDLLQKANSNINKKNWSWGDLVVFSLATFNFSSQAIKTISDGEKLVNTFAKPKLAQMPIDARFFLQIQNPAFALLKKSSFAVKN